MKKRKNKNIKKVNSSNKLDVSQKENKFFKKFIFIFRIVYAVVAWFLLGLKIPTGSSWFISILLYQIPFLIDYISFTVSDKYSKKIRGIEIAYSLIIIVISFVGCAGAFEVIKDGKVDMLQINSDFVTLKGNSFRVFWCWIVLLITPCLNMVDLGQYTSEEEKELEGSFDKSVVVQ